jgi:uncharacterized tellurite resistance protein B-like protein
VWHDYLTSFVMTPLENLYYAAGELAYVVAKADGNVQPAERIKLVSLLKEVLSDGGTNGVDVSSIIFQLLDGKSHQDTESTYTWAMDAIRTNSHYLSPELKEKMIRLLERVAETYPPVTAEENQVIERFRNEIKPLTGDPVFYEAR